MSIPFSQSAIGASLLQRLSAIEARAVSIYKYPIDPLGLADSTIGLTRLFSENKRVYIPEGRYLIAHVGPNAGGVKVSLIDDLEIECHPKAVFVARCDNQALRFSVPNGRAGGKTRFAWRGGYADTSGQPVSTSVPLGASYPPPSGLVGTSGVTDFLYVTGSFTANPDGTGAKVSGLNLAYISELQVVAGAHWQTAGSDSGIFIGDGADYALVEDCVFTGIRDIGVYGSWDSTGALGGPIVVRKCRFFSCFYGCAFKRSASNWQVVDNEFVNCVCGWQTNYLTGGGAVGGIARGNSFDRCKNLFRLEHGRGALIEIGNATRMGALLADGVGSMPQYDEAAVILHGSQWNMIRSGRCLGKDPLYAGQDFRLMLLDGFTPDAGSAIGSSIIQSMYNVIEDFVGISGFYGAGGEVSGEADENRIAHVVAIGGLVPNPSPVSANSAIIRRTVAGQQTFSTPVGMADGSSAAPIIARENQPGTGAYFATNLIGFVCNGVVALTLRWLSSGKAVAKIPLVVYANDATAGTAGLVSGELYQIPSGAVMAKL